MQSVQTIVEDDSSPPPPFKIHDAHPGFRVSDFHDVRETTDSIRILARPRFVPNALRFHRLT